MEFDLTPAEALTVLAEHGGYGSIRVYGILADTHEAAGQIVGIKSRHHLETYPLARLYAKTNDGMPPIRKGRSAVSFYRPRKKNHLTPLQLDTALPVP